MDSRAFEQLVDRHYADLYRFAYSLAKNADDASDITQQTFTIFAQKGGDVRDPAKTRNWLFTTLYREFLKEKSHASRQVLMEEEALETHAPSTAPEPLRHLAHQELLSALGSLDETQRAILSLFYLDQCSYKEIAEIIQMPIGTVMSRLSRAKEALRQKMQDDRGE